MYESRAMNNSRAQSGTRHVKKTHVEISGKNFNCWVRDFFPAETEGQEGSAGI